jgi:hypothetical protein
MAAPTEQYHHHPLPAAPQEAYHQSQQSLSYHQTQPPYQNQQQIQQQQQYLRQQKQEHQPHHPRFNHPQQAANTPASTKHSRTFSFHSEKSQKSSGNKDLQETHAEKESRRLHTKADPTLAMSEAEPSAVAAMKTESFFQPLRSLQHKDNFGNVIAEPDKSNPTRHRWERPLDTIRSFEAAIDHGYSRRSLYQPESAAPMSRRNSYHPGQSQPRFPHESYYGGRPQSLRPESTYHGSTNPGAARSSYFESQGHHSGYNNGHGPFPGRQRTSRMHSEPHFSHHGRENVYPLPHKDRSYETVTSAAGSGNSEAAGYQTDPTSSDNSSIERPAPDKRSEPVINDYGLGFNQQQPYQAPSFSVAVPSGKGKQPLPAIPADSVPQANANVPQKKLSVLKRQPSQQPSVDTSDKRKSWFSRRFSKNA